MPVSLLAATAFLALLATAAVLLERLLARQVKELQAALHRTDQVAASADSLRADLATARERRTRVADTVTGSFDR